ncbi:MAG: hypothetical protein D6803_05875, partial [Anaerolineae bacterium]
MENAISIPTRRKFWLGALLTCLLLLIPGNIAAQTYSFNLESEVVHVYWNADSTITIDYTFVFANDRQASPIDFVDVGLPFPEYDPTSISADVDGQPILNIQESPYVTYGIALGLGENAIPAGQRGTVHVHIGKVTYPFQEDTTNPDYASLVFSPTWFGAEFVHGNTDLTVSLHLPPGVGPSEGRWHRPSDYTVLAGFPPEPETSLDEDGRVTYTWHSTQADGATQYFFGASAPRQYVLATYHLKNQSIEAFLNADGSLEAAYTFEFENLSRQSKLTTLSVPVPYHAERLEKYLATVDNEPISVSFQYATLEVRLGRQAIAPGSSGTIHLSYTIPDQVFFTSWWEGRYRLANLEFPLPDFPSDLLIGETHTQVLFHLPEGVTADQVTAITAPPNFPSSPLFSQDSAGRVTLEWESNSLPATTRNNFTLQVPAEAIRAEALYVYPKPGILERLGIDEGMLRMLGWWVLIGGIFVFNRIRAQRRKMKYLPPRIRIEGHGIKRGLTAVEAGILMELPADRILTMILFSVLKKGAAEVVSKDPLKLKILENPDEKLRYYERDFLEAFKTRSKSTRRKKLQDLIVKMIRNVGKKMRGFSHRETVAYYKSIMEKAWQQIEAADTPEISSKMFEEQMEWTMLDRRFDDRAEEVFRRRRVYAPTWWDRYEPPRRTAPSAARPTPRPTSSSSSSSRPVLPGSEFAASIVRGVENFSSQVVGNLTDFTAQITKRTNP